MSRFNKIWNWFWNIDNVECFKCHKEKVWFLSPNILCKDCKKIEERNKK